MTIKYEIIEVSLHNRFKQILLYSLLVWAFYSVNSLSFPQVLLQFEVIYN